VWSLQGLPWWFKKQKKEWQHIVAAQALPGGWDRASKLRQGWLGGSTSFPETVSADVRVTRLKSVADSFYSKVGGGKKACGGGRASSCRRLLRKEAKEGGEPTREPDPPLRRVCGGACRPSERLGEGEEKKSRKQKGVTDFLPGKEKNWRASRS